MAEEANYEKPSSQIDLETRLARDNAPVGRVLSTSDLYPEQGASPRSICDDGFS